jgi:hypothetical protein
MKIKLSDVRMSFPDLFEPVQFDGKGEYRYGASFFVVKGSPADKVIQDAIKAATTEAWKAKAPAMLEEIKGNANKMCYTNGDTKTYEGAEGCMVLSARRRKTDGRPLLFDGRKNVLTDNDGTLYAGCYVNATVDLWVQVKDYPGVRCTLLGLQKNRDGDAFSGGAKASTEDFDDLGDGADAGMA